MSSLKILSTEIRQLDGLYCLNDLHKASGGERKNTPSRFLRNDQTKALIAEIDQDPNLGFAFKSVHGGVKKGTYVCKQLVVAYGGWINPKVHLAVINAFLDKQDQAIPQQIEKLTPFQQRHIQERISQIVATGSFSYQTLYSKLKSQFSVGTYKDIPSEQYPAVCKYLGCKAIEPSRVDKMSQGFPLQATGHHRYLVATHNGKITHVTDASNHNLVNVEGLGKLRANINTVCQQMKWLVGEESATLLDQPLTT